MAAGLVRACSVAELDLAGAFAVRSGEREAVVVRAGSGEVFALDRACPHEGLPRRGRGCRRDAHLPVARTAHSTSARVPA